MTIKKIKDFNKGDLIRADICSRPNAVNGKYTAGHLGLELEDTRSSDAFFLETLKMKADLADRMIAETESEGKDTTDLKIMKELGEKINAVGKPLHRNESIVTAIFVSLQLIACYGIAIGIWGMVFKKSFIEYSFYGAAAGLLVSLLSAAPVVAFQRTKERMRNIVDGVGLMWGNLGIVIGVVGLIAWVIRLIFIK